MAQEAKDKEKIKILKQINRYLILNKLNCYQSVNKVIISNFISQVETIESKKKICDSFYSIRVSENSKIDKKCLQKVHVTEKKKIYLCTKYVIFKSNL